MAPSQESESKIVDIFSTEEELEDIHNNARQLQAVHGKETEEQDGSDADGEQGGQQWRPPTASPSQGPTASPSLSPTESPTFHPTLHGDPFLLRGETYYDRNANGERDSNIAVAGMGRDVEYSHGLGGVTITLVQCDPETNEELMIEDGGKNTYANAMTTGFDVTMTPMLAQGGGRYTLTNIKINRSYFIRAKAPVGYLFTAGICSEDPDSAWACNPKDGRRKNRFLEGDDNNNNNNNEQEEEQPQEEIIDPELAAEMALGLNEGRSIRCINVNLQGMPDGTLDLGVMRIGDSKEVTADVAIVFGFDDVTTSGRGRTLLTTTLKERILRGVADGTVTKIDEGNGRARYLLGEEDKAAIGSVSAEVIAGTLDGRLSQYGVELDNVTPKNVILNTDDDAGDTLAVAMEIKGHYSPPPDLDFDYIVQDSINRDTDTIRRGLRDYNQNCRDQTTKVLEEGFEESDFEEIHSVAGARPNRGKGNSMGSSGGGGGSNAAGVSIYRTACAEGSALPEYFETSLKEIETRKVSELDDAPKILSMTFMAEESRFESWAMGPVAALSGLIALLMGAFVFRRAIGPRRVDNYREANKTKDLDGDEIHRFGESGGHMDDGSVDSAFYSDSEDEFDEHDKKMRRKRKEKDDMQKGKSTRNYKKNDKSTRKLSSSMLDKDAKTKSSFSASMGSDDTDSIGKYSSDSNDAAALPAAASDKKKLERRNSTTNVGNPNRRKSTEGARAKSMRSSRRASAPGERPKTTKSSKSSRDLSSSTSSNRRGRSTQAGGDNAKAMSDSKII